MNFNLLFALLWTIISTTRVHPSPIRDPMTSSTNTVTGEAVYTIRFTANLLPVHLDQVTLLTWRRSSHLLPCRLPKGFTNKLFYLLLISAGDIEVNPGPATTRWKYPCGVCSKPVRCNQKGIQCDVCTSWLHARCIGLSNSDYCLLQRSDEPWSCTKCINEALPFGDVSTSDSVFYPSADSLDSSSINHSSLSTPQSGLKVLLTTAEASLPI